MATLQFIEATEVGKKRIERPNEDDSWDIDRLDRDIDDEEGYANGGGEMR